MFRLTLSPFGICRAERRNAACQQSGFILKSSGYKQEIPKMHFSSHFQIKLNFKELVLDIALDLWHCQEYNPIFQTIAVPKLLLIRREG